MRHLRTGAPLSLESKNDRQRVVHQLPNFISTQRLPLLQRADFRRNAGSIVTLALGQPSSRTGSFAWLISAKT
jgi:hypothetical protein